MAGKTAYPVRNVQELVDIMKEIDRINPLVRLMLDVEARTGLRNIDARNLKWSTVMINGVVRDSFTVIQSKGYSKRVRNGMTEANAKKAASITVDVNNELRELFEEIYELTGKYELLFQSQHHHAKPNTPISIQYVNRILKRVALKLRLPYQLSTHSMRKSFTAMILSIPGANISNAMTLLGHSDLSSTQRYVNTFENKNKDFTSQISYSVY
ncbi:TPA: tyrosine-type recombinase/integrase [Vibrio parahaemolyticus]